MMMDPGGRMAHLDDFLHEGGPDGMAVAAAEAEAAAETEAVPFPGIWNS